MPKTRRAAGCRSASPGGKCPLYPIMVASRGSLGRASPLESRGFPSAPWQARADARSRSCNLPGQGEVAIFSARGPACGATRADAEGPAVQAIQKARNSSRPQGDFCRVWPTGDRNTSMEPQIDAVTALRVSDMGGFGFRSWSPHPLDQVTFLENDLSHGRREVVFKETDASPRTLAPAGPVITVHKGHKRRDCAGRALGTRSEASGAPRLGSCLRNFAPFAP